eukprot:SAG11_NODE_1442_length_4901_cov_2.114952_4_plen_123_part_00
MPNKCGRDLWTRLLRWEHLARKGKDKELIETYRTQLYAAALATLRCSSNAAAWPAAPLDITVEAPPAGLSLQLAALTAALRARWSAAPPGGYIAPSAEEDDDPEQQGGGVHREPLAYRYQFV